jgi:acetyltransferase-like isoleucine patch superfamily enzyme
MALRPKLKKIALRAPILGQLLRRFLDLEVRMRFLTEETKRSKAECQGPGALARQAYEHGPRPERLLTVRDGGERNVVHIDTGVAASLRGNIILKGDDNRITIGPGCQATNLEVELGSSCFLSIGEDCLLGDLFIYGSDDTVIAIGNNTGFGGTVRLLLHEPGRIDIGAGCLFASEIDVAISDMHSIVDAKTGQRVNPSASVSIGDHVWIGARVMLLKGSQVRQGSIVGACSVVCGLVPENSVAVGAPARVVRSGVTWTHELLPVKSGG